MKHPANAWKNHFAIVATALLATLAPALSQPTQQAYVKAGNAGTADVYGYSVAISGDTMVVGAVYEQSSSRGVNGDGTNNGCFACGAAYVYVRTGTNWVQQAYLKASNAGPNNGFGLAVAISGNTIVVGAPAEGSPATGVNGDQNQNDGFHDSGAAYVFVREGTNWSQQAYLKMSYNPYPSKKPFFGISVGISGNTVVVGAYGEASNSTGVNGVQTNLIAIYTGAAYVFLRDGTNWTQQAYLKAHNSAAHNRFGISSGISGDTIIVGAESLYAPGAAYVFEREGTNWSQSAYLQPSPGPATEFGRAVAVSGDTAAVWATGELSHYVGVNTGRDTNANQNASIAYIFVRNGTNWAQQAHIKPAVGGSHLGPSTLIALSGNTLVMGKSGDESNAVGIDGNENDHSSYQSGAALVYVRRGTNWMRKAYLKASNNNPGDWFGYAVAVSGDTVVVGAKFEDSAATGINGDQNENNAEDSGAAYVFTGFNHGPELTMTPDGTGSFFLRFNAIADLSYRLERSPSVNGPWTTNATLSALTTGPIEIHDTNAPIGQAFYRVAQQ